MENSLSSSTFDARFVSTSSQESIASGSSDMGRCGCCCGCCCFCFPLANLRKRKLSGLGELRTDAALEDVTDSFGEVGVAAGLRYGVTVGALSRVGMRILKSEGDGVDLIDFWSLWGDLSFMKDGRLSSPEFFPFGVEGTWPAGEASRGCLSVD